IRNNAIKVDKAVEGAARAYPVVHGEAFGFLFGREISLIRSARESIFEWRQRAADDLDRAEMGPFDQLLVARNDFVGSANDAISLDCGARKSKVVDANEEHDVRNPRLAQHVALEPRQRADAREVAQNAIAGDALIENRSGNSGFLQTAGKDIGPARIGIDGR